MSRHLIRRALALNQKWVKVQLPQKPHVDPLEVLCVKFEEDNGQVVPEIYSES